MTKYIVEADKLTHSKFGILTKGSKFNADPSEVSELVKDKSIKAFRGKTHKVEEHEVLTEQELLDKGVSQSDIDLSVAEGNEAGETVEISKAGKKGKK